jgi:hypothetical protein
VREENRDIDRARGVCVVYPVGERGECEGVEGMRVWRSGSCESAEE